MDICELHRKHLFFCQECVFIGPLTSYGSTCHNITKVESMNLLELQCIRFRSHVKRVFAGHYMNLRYAYRSLIHSSMSLQRFVGPLPLLQFVIIFTQAVEQLGRGISPSQGRYLRAGQHKHRINIHTDTHALSGIRTHDPSVRASEDSSCLWPCSHYDR
jgi:hypothetical protein